MAAAEEEGLELLVSARSNSGYRYVSRLSQDEVTIVSPAPFAISPSAVSAFPVATLAVRTTSIKARKGARHVQRRRLMTGPRTKRKRMPSFIETRQ